MKWGCAQKITNTSFKIQQGWKGVSFRPVYVTAFGKCYPTTNLYFHGTWVWLPSNFALVNSKEFRREVKDDRCYSQESLYSQDNNLVRLTKANDRRITRMKTWTTRITLVIQTWRLQLDRAVTQQHERLPSSCDLRWPTTALLQ